MRAYTLTHLSDAVLLRDLAALVAQDRATTAALLAHIAEVDARRLYLPAGYTSMHAYCVGELHLSEDAALKRIQAARAARQFPAIFAALAEGWLHLTAVRLLAPHLTPKNAGELLAAAAHRRKSEVERLLAQRFPGPEVPAFLRSITAAVGPHFTNPQHAPGHVGSQGSGLLDLAQLAPAQAVEAAARPDAGGAPQSHERYLLQLTIGKSTHDKLRYAQGLLSHAIPSGDVALVLDRALDVLIDQLEKRKFAVTAKPMRPRADGSARVSVRKRHIPAQVKRAVWERDQGQCTFVGDRGHRCRARKFLEFDHIDPVARGGRATVERMRLRCRAHNQYEAERTFGAGFMSAKRDEARRAAAEARMRAAEAPETAEAPEAVETVETVEAAETRTLATVAELRSRAIAREQTRDVIAGLRGLGCRADEARRAAEFSETLQGATIEERVLAAVKFLGRKPVVMSATRRPPACRPGEALAAMAQASGL